ncbi:MAG: hypothetical protein ABS91_00770 [Thiobacillus sp. SCN 64-35]|nr:MAG: hypothetical protein ABS91_00770 [Thiobacillus sp. SCN 64-35]
MMTRRDILLSANALIVLLAYLLPEWAAFARSEVFVFVNGWDEETYLSWQGVLGSRNDLGYFVLHLYGLLHEAGLSGAMQNLLSDTLFPLLTVLLVAQSFRLRGVEAVRAFAYAVLVLFSSTLFNYANPVIKDLLGEYDGTAFLMAGWELYPSLLRTPNPQLSYFLLALAVYAWLKWRRFWLLLLPLPLLYYFVAVPYAFLIAVGVALPVVRRILPLPAWKATAVSAVAVYVLMALGAVGLFTFAGYYDPDNWVVKNAWVFAQTRMPQLPLVLLFVLPVVLLLRRFDQLDAGRSQGRNLLVLLLAAVAAVNLHVVTGFMLSQKNYYDYGLSILFGLMLVVVLEWMKSRRSADWALVVLLAITAIPTLASHLYFYHRSTAISAKAAPFISEVRRDPLHAVIPDLDVSSRMAYSTARLLAPPFSYQYYFPFIEKQCRYYPELLSAGLSQARQGLATREGLLGRLESTSANIRRGQIESRAVAYKILPYCTPEAYQPDDFKLLGIDP